MADKISSLDDGYVTGDLSVYPAAIDSFDTLYEAKNNAKSKLSHSLSFNANFILVEDSSSFPDKGLVKIGTEIIYYNEKGTGILKDLKRGFVGSQQNRWLVGTEVLGSVMAEHHNALKDAIYNIEHFMGLKENPDEASFNGRLTRLERKFLSPKPLFRAYPRIGATPLKVQFQNFSNNTAVRFLWDFGDGTQSQERSPTHTYLSEGNFTVQLHMITSLNGQGIITKNEYIEVNDDLGLGFMYVTPEAGTTSTTFTFVDQTDGDIVRRYWSFDDGERETVDDPDVHTITHTYTSAGTYDPKLLVVFADTTTKTVLLGDSIIVT